MTRASLDYHRPRRHNPLLRVRDATAATTDGAAENVERLSQKHTRRPDTSYGGPGQTRILPTIAVDTVIHAPVH